jgi:exonuclease SbcD
MRICHLADTHLGYRNLNKLTEDGINQREADVYAAFEEAISQIIELNPDAVIHAGDLFDSYHPTSRALGVALDAMRELDRAGIPLLVIAGNHSTPRYASTGHVFEVIARFGNVHAVWRKPERIRIGDLAVYAIPHTNDAERLTEAICAAVPDHNSACNVLTLHAGLDGLARVGGSESGSVSVDPASLEAAGEFDYIALGHLHTREPVRTNACYAGSLERLTFADTSRRKGFYEIDFDHDALAPGRVRTHDVTAREMHDLSLVDSSEDLDLAEQIIAAAEGVKLDGALVRCRVSVSQDRWRALDMAAVRRHFSPCLHLELQPQFAEATSGGLGAPEDIATFIAARLRKGENAHQLTDRVQQLLAQADEAIQS